MSTWNGLKDWTDGEIVYASDMNAYVSNNIGFLFESMPPLRFGAAQAILPSSDAATSTQFESGATDDFTPNWTELVFSGSADNAAQWNFRSWFASSDVTGLKFSAYTTDATASTDDVDIVVSVSSLSGNLATETFNDWTTTTIDEATLEDAAHTLTEYSIPAPAASDWDGLTYGSIGTIQLKRLGSADELPLALHVLRVWVY